MAEPVSVIVLCHDRWEHTRRCLESLRRSTPVGTYEVLAYDNASTDGTYGRLRAWSKRWKELRPYRNATNLPFARAVNRGMVQARGSWIVWLNNDAVVSPGWLEGLLRVGRSADVGAVGPMTDHMAPPHQLIIPFRTRARGKAADVSFLGGFCLLVNRDAVAKVGPLDERFVWGWEDVDYCLRLRAAGKRLLLARDVFVAHGGSVTLNAMPVPQRLRQDESNRALFWKKWRSAQPWAAEASGLLRDFPRLEDASRGRPRVSILVAADGPAEQAAAFIKATARDLAGLNVEFVTGLLDADAREQRRFEALAGVAGNVRVLGPWRGIGATHALNLAWRRADGEHICVLPFGAAPSRGWLKALLRVCASSGNVGAVGPRAEGRPGSARATPVGYLRGSCLLVRRAVFERAGAFDDRFAGSLRSADYCLRVSQAGYQVLLAEDALVVAPRAAGLVASRADSKLLFQKWAGHPLFEAEAHR